MKKLSFVLLMLLTGVEVIGQMKIDGYLINESENSILVYSHKKLIPTDECVWKEEKKEELKVYINRISRQVFSEKELKILTKLPSGHSRVRTVLKLNGNGDVQLDHLWIPIEDKEIFSEDKIKKLIAVLGTVNLKDYISFFTLKNPELSPQEQIYRIPISLVWP